MRELAGEHDPLLVAAREGPHRRIRARAGDGVSIDQFRGLPLHQPAVHQSVAGDSARIGDDEVLGHGEVEDAPGVVAVLRDHRHARARHRPRSARDDVGAVDLDAPGVERSQARQHVAEDTLAVALHPGDADDLALVHVETQCIEERPTVTAAKHCVDDPQRRDACAVSPAGIRLGAAAGTSTTPKAECSPRSETSRPTMARASDVASLDAVERVSTTRPPRMIVITSVADKTSGNLWLTKATALPSSSTTRRKRVEQELGLCGRQHRGRLVEHEHRRDRGGGT